MEFDTSNRCNLLYVNYTATNVIFFRKMHVLLRSKPCWLPTQVAFPFSLLPEFLGHKAKPNSSQVNAMILFPWPVIGLWVGM